MMTKSSRHLFFDTPDGNGEAVKLGAGQHWAVNCPTGSFEFFGSLTELQSEIKKVLRSHYKEERES